MIISCNNCNKKFDLDSNLISDKGRLLQCAGCNHKWFFKKEILDDPISPIVEDIDDDSVNIFEENNTTNNAEINLANLPRKEVKAVREEPEKNIEVNTNESITAKTQPKRQKDLKIFNIFIVTIISFVAFIIIVDTFKHPIGKIVPNIEFILYNLYESIKDISLFIRDLT